MRITIIESPFGTRPEGGRCTPVEVNRNVAYARACLEDSLKRGEAPFASHLFYPQVLDDATPEEREKGIRAGLAIATAAHATVVYEDRGITDGMIQGIEHAKKHGRPIERRRLGPWWSMG